MEPKTAKNLVTIDIENLNFDIPDDIEQIIERSKRIIMASQGIPESAFNPAYDAKPEPKPVDRHWARTTERILLK